MSERFNTGNWPRCCKRGCENVGKVSTYRRGKTIFQCDEHLPKRVLKSVLAARAAAEEKREEVHQ